VKASVLTPRTDKALPRIDMGKLLSNATQCRKFSLV
jgi:hypothetical protein